MFNTEENPVVINGDLVVFYKLTETQLEKVVAEVGLVINVGDNTYVPKEWAYVLMSAEKRRTILVMYFTKLLVEEEDREQSFNDMYYVTNLSNSIEDVIDYLNNQDYYVHSILGGE